MKSNILKISVALGLTLALLGTPAVYAKESIKTTLASATPVELPAKAAALVSAAADKEKAVITVEVVKDALTFNPASAPAVVAAIAHDVPSMAPLAAVTAATLQRKQLGQIAQAAAAGAPSQAGLIVSALIKEFPSHYPLIASAVAKGAPASGKEILAAVGSSVPSLQSSIQASVATFGANTGALPVDTIVNQSSLTAGTSPTPQILRSPAQVFAPPVIGPPFTPLPPSPGELNNSGTSPEQPGGRSYASP